MGNYAFLPEGAVTVHMSPIPRRWPPVLAFQWVRRPSNNSKAAVQHARLKACSRARTVLGWRHLGITGCRLCTMHAMPTPFQHTFQPRCALPCPQAQDLRQVTDIEVRHFVNEDWSRVQVGGGHRIPVSVCLPTKPAH